MSDLEFRATCEGISVRSSPERRGGGVELSGYGAVYNILSSDLGGYRESLLPGCFATALRNLDCDTVFLVDHDPSKLLGRRSAGTLSVSEDSHGLVYHCRLPNSEFAAQIAESVRRGDLKGCSFGFSVGRGGDSWKMDSGERRREIRSICTLSDVSVVTYPAYPTGTSVSLGPRPAMRAVYPDAEMVRRIEAASRGDRLRLLEIGCGR